MFKRKPKAGPTVEPFRHWSIRTLLPGGAAYVLEGNVYTDVAPNEALRYVNAIADGLRAADFEAEVRITRETVSER